MPEVARPGAAVLSKANSLAAGDTPVTERNSLGPDTLLPDPKAKAAVADDRDLFNACCFALTTPAVSDFNDADDSAAASGGCWSSAAPEVAPAVEEDLVAVAGPGCSSSSAMLAAAGAVWRD